MKPNLALLALILLSLSCGMQLPEQAVRIPIPAPVPVVKSDRFERGEAKSINALYWNDDVLEWRVK